MGKWGKIGEERPKAARTAEVGEQTESCETLLEVGAWETDKSLQSGACAGTKGRVGGPVAMCRRRVEGSIT